MTNLDHVHLLPFLKFSKSSLSISPKLLLWSCFILPVPDGRKPVSKLHVNQRHWQPNGQHMIWTCLLDSFLRSSQHDLQECSSSEKNQLDSASGSFTVIWWKHCLPSPPLTSLSSPLRSACGRKTTAIHLREYPTWQKILHEPLSEKYNQRLQEKMEEGVN